MVVLALKQIQEYLPQVWVIIGPRLRTVAIELVLLQLMEGSIVKVCNPSNKLSVTQELEISRALLQVPIYSVSKLHLIPTMQRQENKIKPVLYHRALMRKNRTIGIINRDVKPVIMPPESKMDHTQTFIRICTWPNRTLEINPKDSLLMF